MGQQVPQALTMNLPTNPSESFKRRNPDLYAGSVATLQGAKREPDSSSSLDGGNQGLQECQGRVVVGIVRCHKRKPYDDDNMVAGAKSLRDSIASSIGCDDGDPRISWEYHQVKTSGPEGTIVTISLI